MTPPPPTRRVPSLQNAQGALFDDKPQTRSTSPWPSTRPQPASLPLAAPIMYVYSEMSVDVGRVKAYPPVGLAASEDDDALRARLAFRDVADLRVTNSNKLL